MPHVNVYPDPDIREGPYRVLPRTDGGFVVVDERRPAGAQEVRSKKTREVMRWGRVEDAAVAARMWASALTAKEVGDGVVADRVDGR